MSMLSTITGGFSRWIDSVARSIDGLVDRYRSRRFIRLIENDDGTFTFQIAETAGKSVTWLTKRRLWRPRKRANPPGMLAPVGSRIVDGALTESLPVDWMTALRQPRRGRPAPAALLVPAAGIAAAGCRFSRRHCSRADRQTDAVARQRRGIRLDSPTRSRRSDQAFGRGDRPQHGLAVRELAEPALARTRSQSRQRCRPMPGWLRS
jgi:hypothetical protein